MENIIDLFKKSFNSKNLSFEEFIEDFEKLDQENPEKIAMLAILNKWNELAIEPFTHIFHTNLFYKIQRHDTLKGALQKIEANTDMINSCLKTMKKTEQDKEAVLKSSSPINKLLEFKEKRGEKYSNLLISLMTMSNEQNEHLKKSIEEANARANAAEKEKKTVLEKLKKQTQNGQKIKTENHNADAKDQIRRFITSGKYKPMNSDEDKAASLRSYLQDLKEKGLYSGHIFTIGTYKKHFHRFEKEILKELDEKTSN